MSTMSTATGFGSDESAADWATTSFDPWDQRITHRNVWAMYRVMRGRGRAVWSEAHGGFWSITHYQDVRDAAADFRTFSSAQRGVVIGRDREQRATPLELDRPEHTRYRRALQEPFMPKRIGQFEGLVRRSAGAALDRIAGLEEFDVVHDLAEHLPFHVISVFLGIEDTERQRLHRQLAIDLVNADLATLERADEAYVQFLREEVADRRARPGEDFISELSRVEVDGRAFDDEEVARLSRALALAGHHTTINGIASLLMRISDDEQRRRYLHDDEFRPRVVEETLRIDSPIHLEARTATVATRIGDVEIAPGTMVALLYASANHDEAVYPEPERFDPLREGPTNLSFGHGLHKCLGAPLARLEMTIVLEEVLHRFPRYRLTAEPVGTGMFFGHHMGWASMPAVTVA